MTDDVTQKSPEQTLIDFNSDLDSYIKENSGRILCIMAYSVSFEFQPYVASFQKYFNQEVILKYDTKSIYAYNLDLPNFLAVYFIKKKETHEKSNGTDNHKKCLELVSKFSNFNEHALSGLSAVFFDEEESQKIDEFHFGNEETLIDVEFLKQ
ncbi:MAG: hypothetical protein ACR2NW_09430 [Thermodesulfobacteriota bacterium]